MHDNLFLYMFGVGAGMAAGHAYGKLRHQEDHLFQAEMPIGYLRHGTFYAFASGVGALSALGLFISGFFIYPYWYPIVSILGASIVYIVVVRPMIQPKIGETGIVLYGGIASVICLAILFIL